MQGEFDIPDAAYAAALGWTDWPARLQRLRAGRLFDRLPQKSELWVDGGHNPAAAREVAMAIKAMDDMPLTIIFAALTTKDAEGLLAPFDGMTRQVITLGIDHHSSHPPDWLAELARGMGHDAAPAASLEEAFKRIGRPGRVLVFGSLYLAGELLDANDTLPD